MATFICKTRNEANPKGKPRVYFTCHPDDFSRHFEKICADIFKTHDCAIYYTQDFSEEIPEEDLETDLGQMNLFIVPVTFKLLGGDCRAIRSDIAYAKEKCIPMIPFMMESGLDELYARPECFGNRQYINPYSHDLTEISYEQKLKKILDAVLINEETANRVRAAFDAYIFLSYRKKDRKYANELMKLVHKSPECRNIAIWYDEFLTPGENFEESIAKAMEKSELFALLVTPNILEERDGQPNFVMGVEYPEACKMHKHIIPAEMEETDKTELAKKFAGLSECINPREVEGLKKALLTALKGIAISENDNDPEHNYLIGLAYRDGIDVEVDIDRALELITSSAEAGLIEAMKTLCEMYFEGKIVRHSSNEALKWAERIYKSYLERLGESAVETVGALHNLASCYSDCGIYEEGLRLGEKAYQEQVKLFGKENSKTLYSLGNLVGYYLECGKYNEALQLNKEGYDLCVKVFGEEHPDTLLSLCNLAKCYSDCGEFKEALKLAKKSYDLRLKVLGEEHPDTILSLSNLALNYYNCGEYEKALELGEKAYKISVKALGKGHPTTVLIIANLAGYYSAYGAVEEALRFGEEAYELHCKLLGEEHPDAIFSLVNLAKYYSDCEREEESAVLNEKAYKLSVSILGETHPNSIFSLINYGMSCANCGNNEESIRLNQKAYELCMRFLGNENPCTIRAVCNLAVNYMDLGDYKQSAKLYKTAYDLQVKMLGEEHPETMYTLGNLTMATAACGDVETALRYCEKIYVLQVELLGENHPETIATRESIDNLLGLLGGK